MAREWYLLFHKIPPKPLYLRAKIRHRLARVGAVALKNSVYVLPMSPDALEDFQWVTEEVASGGGQAWICGGELLGGIDETSLIELFHAAREEDYAAIRDELARIDKPRRRGMPPATEDTRMALNRVRDRLSAIQAIDYFDSPAGKEITTMIRSIETKLERTAARRRRTPANPRGRTWVTRAGIKIDRIASAWLIRRFLDPDARFRFVDASRWSKTEDDIAFDIVGGDYTHEADRCTFETLVERFGVRDRAVRAIAEIVHDLDIKDGKFERNEAPGIRLVIHGLVSAHPTDEDRLERGLALFDDLAHSLAGSARTTPRTRGRTPSKETKRGTSPSRKTTRKKAR